MSTDLGLARSYVGFWHTPCEFSQLLHDNYKTSERSSRFLKVIYENRDGFPLSPAKDLAIPCSESADPKSDQAVPKRHLANPWQVISGPVSKLGNPGRDGFHFSAKCLGCQSRISAYAKQITNSFHKKPKARVTTVPSLIGRLMGHREAIVCLSVVAKSSETKVDDE